MLNLDLKKRTDPFPVTGARSGRRIGEEELAELREVIESGALNKNLGAKVNQFEQAFASYYSRKHCIMVTSGTAAIHVALGALGLNPGDEVITSPITDMGTVCPILLLNAIPVFADLDPDTFLMDPASVEANITDRTRAILPVHLAGYPCPMEEIRAIAVQHGLSVVEDCAQAYCCGYKGKWVGQLTEMGCFSLNQHKHIQCGDGGMIVTDDNELAYRAQLFADKGWPRSGPLRDHLLLAPNYRVTELQAAVAVAQLQRLNTIVADRVRISRRIQDEVRPRGLFQWMRPVEGADPSYYFLPAKLPGDRKQVLMNLIADWNLPVMDSYLSKPIYQYRVLAELKTFGDSGWPHKAPGIQSTRTYPKGLCPVAEQLVQEMFVVRINENYDNEMVDYIIAVVNAAVEALQ